MATMQKQRTVVQTHMNFGTPVSFCRFWCSPRAAADFLVGHFEFSIPAGAESSRGFVDGSMSHFSSSLFPMKLLLGLAVPSLIESGRECAMASGSISSVNCFSVSGIWYMISRWHDLGRRR